MIASLLALASTWPHSIFAAITADTASPPPDQRIDYVQLILQASLPVKIVVLCLLAGSLMSWAIIMRKGSLFKRTLRQASDFEGRFWSGADLGKLYATVSDRHHPVSGLGAIFEAGFREFTRLRERHLDARVQLEGSQRAMRTTMRREIDDLEQNLELLANIGSTAPYVGLVGTVFGIMITMHDMVASGQQSGIAAVAPGISEALAATAIGLFVAIPAVWGYNRLTTRLERIAVRYETFAEEFSSILQRQAGNDR